MILGAQIVIGQRAQDVAFTHRMARAVPGHTHQLPLQPLQTRDARTHGYQLLGRNFVGRVACAFWMTRQVEQIANSIDGKAEITRMADEGQTIELVATKTALIALAALRRREQADIFIVADGRNLHASSFCQIANRKH